MAQIGLTIMLEDDAQARMEEIVRVIERSGVHVKQKLPHLGTVIGVGDESKIHELEAVAGIEMVRPEARFTLPRMDEDVPQ